MSGWKAELRSAIRNDSTRAAFDCLVDVLHRHDLTPSPNTGKARAVRFHDQANRYAFSFIVNPHHLLFYVRRPALSAAPHLKESAAKALVNTSTNPGGEVKVRIETKADAEKLSNWLITQLPLP